MSLSAEIQRQFLKAAQNDPAFQIRPTLHIKLSAFERVFAPIKDYMDNDPSYSGQPKTISRQIEALRQMCIEAHAAHTTDDERIKDRRNKLLNTLQDLLEEVKEVENV